jgi:hypothetical protein
MSHQNLSPAAELTDATLSCLSEYSRFQHSRQVLDLIRQQAKAPEPAPLGPITTEELGEDATDPVYMELLINAASIQGRYDNMTPQDYRDEFSGRLADMNQRVARLGRAVIGLLPKDGMVESYGVDPESDTGKVVIDQDGIHYYSRPDTPTPKTYNPRSADFYMGFLNIAVIVPYICNAGAQLVREPR